MLLLSIDSLSKTYAIATLIISIVGACAWSAPFLYAYFTKSQLKVKLISQLVNKGTFTDDNKKDHQGLIHFYAFNCIALNKAFNIKSVSASVKYMDNEDDKEYKGHIFWAVENRWQSSGGSQYLHLSIKPEDTIPFVGTIPPSITKRIYLTFWTDKANPAPAKNLYLSIEDYKNKKHEFEFPIQEINIDQILWDTRIWIPIQDKKPTGEVSKTT